jgi:hypothetical protein
MMIDEGAEAECAGHGVREVAEIRDRAALIGRRPTRSPYPACLAMDRLNRRKHRIDHAYPDA